jgi:hypothetical protein
MALLIGRDSRIYPTDRGRGTLFELAECESCGGQVAAPNAVTVYEIDTHPVLRDVRRVAVMPPEIWWDEATGATRCEACPPHQEGESDG